MSKYHIIFIPGIGDHKTYYQPQILTLWKLFGLRVHYHPVIWKSKNQSWDKKLDKLSILIRHLHKQGDKVSLVGVSAGASAALNAYWANKDKVEKVIFICGKLNNPESVGEVYYQKNPSFKDSVYAAAGLVKQLKREDNRRIMSLHGLYDETVPVQDSVINGTTNRAMPTLFHVPSIFIAITLCVPIISKFIKIKT